VEHALVDIPRFELRDREKERTGEVRRGKERKSTGRSVKNVPRSWAGAKKRGAIDVVFARIVVRGPAKWEMRTVTSTWYPTSTSATNARRSRSAARPAGGIVVVFLRTTRITGSCDLD